MARSAGNVVENNFTRGLITEATGLNFPENAVTETWDCVYEQKGQVRRRLGIDLEEGAQTVAQNNRGALVEFLWEAVSQNGTRIFLVLQTGDVIGFYELQSGANFSGQAKPFAVVLTDYNTVPSGVLHEMPCAFAAGNGRLFICHPLCNPIMVEYDEIADDIEQTEILIKVRDFEGVEDGLEPAEEPSTLSPEHHYNLKNQGWYPDTVTVVTSVTTRNI
jgi:hypothetical protein